MDKENSIDHEDQNGAVGVDHVLKYTGIFGGVQGLIMLVSIVRNKLVAMLIGRTGMGIIDVFNRSLELVSNTTNFGVSFSAVQHISTLYGKGSDAEMTQYIRVVRSWALLTALLGMIVCMLFSPLISLFTYGDYGHTLSFFLLAPIVAMIAVSGGEMAILKGLRRLKLVVYVTALMVVTTLFTTVPFYWRWGIDGIVPALLLSTACATVIQLYFSCRVIPWHVSFRRSVFSEGFSMIRLGVAYILAGVLGAGAEMAIRVLIRHWGDFNDVGLYAAGTTLIVAYAGLIFKALDSDFFPRLSSLSDNVVETNTAVCQQIEICVLLIVPFLIAFMLAVPIIVPLLYTGKFMPAVPMVVTASFYLFFKAISLPVSYMPLAKGDSKVYLAMEACYDVAFVLLMTFGYALWNLLGAGIALSAAYLFDLLLVVTFYHHHYGFRFTAPALRIILVQAIFAVAGLVLAFQPIAWIKYGLGAFIFLFSAFYSYRILKRETNFVERLCNKLRKTLTR